jgi:tetratricopeptide (TPR) repeat protein
VAAAASAARSKAERLVREGGAIEFRGFDKRTNFHLPISASQRRRALAKYTQAIALDPTFVDVYLVRAHTRSRLNDPAGSRADAEAAYALRLSDPMAYLSIASAFRGSTQRKIIRAGLSRATPGGWEHLHLGWYSTNTYWYEGRFDLQVASLRRLLRRFSELGKRRLANRLHCDLGTALMALGRYATAEKEFRLAAAAGGTHSALACEGVVRSRIYQDDLRGALRELDRLAGKMEASDVAITRAYIQALMPQSPAPTPDAARRAADLSIDGYNGFMNAVVLLRSGRADLARPRLRKFIDRCESNPSEWGVTRRWEIAKARELLGQRTRVSR